MWNKLRLWIKNFRKSTEVKVDPPQHSQIRRKVDTQAIRERIQNQGWQLKEIPIRTNKDGETSIARWKLIAHKGVQSIEVGGKNIDEAMMNAGQVLGLVSRSVIIES